MSSLSGNSKPNQESIVKRKPNALIMRRNWRDTRAYLRYCKEVKQNKPRSVQFASTALDHLLRWATHTSFNRAPDIRPVYPTHLMDSPTSATYQKKLLSYARSFLQWSRDQWPNRYTRITNAWISTLKTKKKPGRIHTHEVFSLSKVRALLSLTAAGRVDRRDLAAVAMLFLSGMRVSAFCSLPLRAVSFDQSPVLVRQWPDWGVLTKNSKAANTYLLPASELPDLHRITQAWHTKALAAVGPRGMWYTLLEPSGEFALNQVPGEHRSAGLRRRLMLLCGRAGIGYLSPHKLRRGHIVWASERCQSMADFKAVSLNVMHESVTMTDSRYSGLPDEAVAERIARLSPAMPDSNDLVNSLFGEKISTNRG